MRVYALIEELRHISNEDAYVYLESWDGQMFIPQRTDAGLEDLDGDAAIRIRLLPTHQRVEEPKEKTVTVEIPATAARLYARYRQGYPVPPAAYQAVGDAIDKALGRD